MPWLLEHHPASEEWEKRFSTKEEARLELLSHICAACLAGGEWGDIDANGNTSNVIPGDHPPDQNDLDELLATPCGVEYGVHEVE